MLQIFKDILRNLYESNFDPLTRILNRHAFDCFMVDIAYPSEAALSIEGKRISVIAILDIDLFKKVNDRYGHAIGDKFCYCLPKLYVQS